MKICSHVCIYIYIYMYIHIRVRTVMKFRTLLSSTAYKNTKLFFSHFYSPQLDTKSLEIEPRGPQNTQKEPKIAPREPKRTPKEFTFHTFSPK